MMAEQVKKKERRTPQPEQRTFERNAKGVREMMSIKYDTFDFDGDWYQAFGRPEKRGVWLIWGQSGNGKTSFVMQLCKYLCRFGRVAYNSLEEGASLTMQNSLKRFNMMEVNRRFLLIDAESMEQLDIRLHRQKSPDFVVIDSFQYTQQGGRKQGCRICFFPSIQLFVILFNRRKFKYVLWRGTAHICQRGFH